MSTETPRAGAEDTAATGETPATAEITLTDERPILVITLGPTGSGKGGALKKLKESHPGIDKLNHLIETGVDEIVVKHKYYKSQMKTFLTDKIKETRYDEKDDEGKKEIIKDLILKLNTEEYKKIEQFYFEARYNRKNDDIGGLLDEECDFRKDNSRYQKRPLCKSLDGSCEKQNDEQIEEAITNGETLLIESTGTYYPSWLLNTPTDYPFNYADKLNRQHYQVIFIWNYVQICTLVKRILDRTINQIVNFLKDPTENDAPRFPNFLRLIEELPEIYKNFYSKRTFTPEKSNLTYINYYIDNTPEQSEHTENSPALKPLDNTKLQNKYTEYDIPASNFLDAKIKGITLLTSLGFSSQTCNTDLVLINTIRQKLIKEKIENKLSPAQTLAELLTNARGGALKKKKKNL